MSLRSFCVVPLFALGLLSGPAVADIYKWEDATGRVTISNLPPPKGARLIVVVPDTPAPPPRVVAVGEDEMRRLSERIQSLEREIRLSGRPPPPPPEYAPAPQAAACDPQTTDCSAWWAAPQFLGGPVATFPVPFRQDRRGRHFGGHAGSSASRHESGGRPR